MPAPVTQALLSVSDKTGLVDFARGLVAPRRQRSCPPAARRRRSPTRGSRSPRSATTRVSGDARRPREDAAPEGARRHPRAARSAGAHGGARGARASRPIDLVVVNLYPFRETVAKTGCTLDDAIENIDIGGPTMVRAAAKNWQHVGVVVDPADYAALLAELAANGGALVDGHALRARAQGVLAYGVLRRRDLELAHRARRGRRGRGVSRPLQPAGDQGPGPALRREPASAGGVLPRRDAGAGSDRHLSPAAGQGALVQQHRGFRRRVGMREVARRRRRRRVRDRQARQSLRRRDRGRRRSTLTATAFATDPVSAFGGIIAFNRPVDAATLEAVAAQFLEVLIAPGYTDDALEVIAQKKNVRVLEVALPAADARRRSCDLKRVGGGFLLQTPTRATSTPAELKVVTAEAPTPAQLADLLFAWRVAKFVKINAIVYCGGGRTLGIGAGQMSRVDSARDRRDQGEERRAVARRLGRRVRRVLSVSRRARRRRRQRRGRRDPARRQRARRRGDRRRRRARHRDGVHRHPAFSPLTSEQSPCRRLRWLSLLCRCAFARRSLSPSRRRAECADLWDWLNTGCRRLVDTYQKGNNEIIVSGLCVAYARGPGRPRSGPRKTRTPGAAAGRAPSSARTATRTSSIFLVFSDSHSNARIQPRLRHGRPTGARATVSQPGLGYTAMIVARHDIFNG